MMHMIPHLSVPSTSHHRTTSASTGRPDARGVRGEQLVVGPDAGHRQRRPEAPGLHAEPAQVLHRVAHVGQLPVDDRRQARLVDDQVAEPEVPVHDGRPDRRRPVGLQPAEPQLEGGMGLADGVEDLAGTARPGRWPRGRARSTGSSRVQRGQRLPQLGGERGAGGGEALVAEDAAGDGLARDLRDDHERRAERRRGRSTRRRPRPPARRPRRPHGRQPASTAMSRSLPARCRCRINDRRDARAVERRRTTTSPARRRPTAAAGPRSRRRRGPTASRPARSASAALVIRRRRGPSGRDRRPRPRRGGPRSGGAASPGRCRCHRRSR